MHQRSYLVCFKCRFNLELKNYVEWVGLQILEHGVSVYQPSSLIIEFVFTSRFDLRDYLTMTCVLWATIFASAAGMGSTSAAVADGPTRRPVSPPRPRRPWSGYLEFP